MFKIFSKDEKYFISHNIIFSIPLSIVGIFVSFFIWDKTHNLIAIAIFQVFCAVGILIGSFVGAYFLNKVSSSILRILGTFLSAISIGLIILVSGESFRILGLLGFSFGFSLGFRAQAYRLLFLKIVRPTFREKFLNINNLAYSIAGIVIPFLAALLVSKTGSYTVLFICLIAFFIVSVLPLLKLKLDIKSSKFEIFKTIKEVETSVDLKKLTLSKFFEGINIGIDNSVWSIIILVILGNLQNWGIFNAVFATLSAIITYTVGKRIEFSNSKIFFSIAAVAFTLAGLYFALEFNFVSYMVFSFISGIASNLFDTSFQSIESKIKDRKINDNENIDEFNLVQEISSFLGRIIPYLFILILKPSFENDLLLRMFVIVVSAIPLLISSILSGTSVVRRSADLFVRN